MKQVEASCFDSIGQVSESRVLASGTHLVRVTCRLYGNGKAVAAEKARVEAAGGWVTDGRVCDILAVSRAFGDRQFKGDGLEQLVTRGLE